MHGKKEAKIGGALHPEKIKKISQKFMFSTLTHQNVEERSIESDVEVQPTVHQSSRLGIPGVEAAIGRILVDEVGQDGSAEGRERHGSEIWPPSSRGMRQKTNI